MRSWPPLACTAGVLAVHIALLAALSHHMRSSAGEPGTRTRTGQRLVLLDAERVAALTRPNAPDRAASIAQSASAASFSDRRTPPPADASAASETAAFATRPPAQEAGVGIYRPSTALDFPIRPRSAPDISALAGIAWSGLPFRVRLFIDANGTVVDVQVLQSAEDPALVEGVRKMFLSTGFTAGIENGKPVPCYKDIELTLSTPT